MMELEAGDVALYCTRWRLRGTDPAESPVHMSGRSSDILRRQPDGNWLIALDKPLGHGYRRLAIAMSRRSDFVEFVTEQMSFIGGLRVRAMFGGYGVYQDSRIFAIIVDDRLYFKADSIARAEFEAKGLSPFTYVARGKSVTMRYFEAPPEVFEEPEAMRSWVQKALGVAIRAKEPNKALQRTRKKPRAGQLDRYT